jgi:hypothetical protein
VRHGNHIRSLVSVAGPLKRVPRLVVRIATNHCRQKRRRSTLKLTHPVPRKAGAGKGQATYCIVIENKLVNDNFDA